MGECEGQKDIVFTRAAPIWLFQSQDQYLGRTKTTDDTCNAILFSLIGYLVNYCKLNILNHTRQASDSCIVKNDEFHNN